MTTFCDDCSRSVPGDTLIPIDGLLICPRCAEANYEQCDCGARFDRTQYAVCPVCSDQESPTTDVPREEAA